MATSAVHGGWEVCTVFACGGCTVVTCRACRCRGVRRVVRLGTKPGACGCMATLAIAGYSGMDGRRRLACHTIGRGQVTGCTLVGHRCIGVEASRIPGYVPRGCVAGITVGRRDRIASQRLIRNVIGCLSVR